MVGALCGFPDQAAREDFVDPSCSLEFLLVL